MRGERGGEVEANIQTNKVIYQRNLEFRLSTNGNSQLWKGFQRQLGVQLMLHSGVCLMNLE